MAVMATFASTCPGTLWPGKTARYLFSCQITPVNVPGIITYYLVKNTFFEQYGHLLLHISVQICLYYPDKLWHELLALYKQKPATLSARLRARRLA